jgi:hypothetical protein
VRSCWPRRRRQRLVSALQQFTKPAVDLRLLSLRSMDDSSAAVDPQRAQVGVAALVLSQ